jgi:gas vesicle protein
MASVLKYAGVALAAAAAGAALGLLFAPAPGVVTRRRLAYRIDEKRQAISERGRAMRDTVTGRRTRLAEVVNG